MNKFALSLGLLLVSLVHLGVLDAQQMDVTKLKRGDKVQVYDFDTWRDAEVERVIFDSAIMARYFDPDFGELTSSMFQAGDIRPFKEVPKLKPPKFRYWASSNGKFKVLAKLESYDDTSVKILRKEDGELLTVELNKLSQKDRDYVAKRGETEKAIEAAKAEKEKQAAKDEENSNDQMGRMEDRMKELMERSRQRDFSDPDELKKMSDDLREEMERQNQRGGGAQNRSRNRGNVPPGNFGGSRGGPTGRSGSDPSARGGNRNNGFNSGRNNYPGRGGNRGDGRSPMNGGTNFGGRGDALPPANRGDATFSDPTRGMGGPDRFTPPPMDSTPEIRTASSPTKLSNSQLGFDLVLPGDFENAPPQVPRRADDLYVYVSYDPDPTQPVVFRMERMRGVFDPKKRISQGQAPPNAKLGELRWKDQFLQTIIVTEQAPGLGRYINYNIQMPLSGEAVQITVGGPEVYSPIVEQKFKEVVNSFENHKPLYGEPGAERAPLRKLTDRERQDRLIKAATRLALVFLAVVVLVAGGVGTIIGVSKGNKKKRGRR